MCCEILIFFVTCYYICSFVNCEINPRQQKPVTEVQKKLVTSANVVAFSVSLSHHLTLGPNQAVQYDKIITNIGNAYDPNHGHMITPSLGIYILSATCVNLPQDDDRLEIVKNGDLLTSFFTQGKSTYSSMSQIVVVSLEKDDVLWIRMYNKQDYSGHHLYGTSTEYYNTFSGILIFPL